jgi:hypothetical protein
LYNETRKALRHYLVNGFSEVGKKKKTKKSKQKVKCNGKQERTLQKGKT